MQETPYIQRHLFRILHIDNLEKILKKGMYAPRFEFDPEYISIGDEVLIAQRGEFNVPIAPGGVLSDYVPFYFGGCSPMLLNIKTGYRGVKQREQTELIYICTHIECIVNAGLEFCFTDGHAKDRLTRYFNQIADLDQVDWAVVGTNYWKSTDEDPDRMRHKQAEFLVKNNVPVSCISGIIVHDESAAIKVKTIMEKVGVSLPVHIDANHKYYFND